MRLSWLTPPALSGLHACEALGRGLSLVDAALQALLAEPARRLESELSAAGLPRGRFWSHFPPHAASMGPRAAVDVTLRKLWGTQPRLETVASRLAACLAEVDAICRRHWPRLAEELQLRVGPLRGQWEARGPGMLRFLAELTEPGLLVESAGVLLVQPALGGGGAAHLHANQVRFEAVLANPTPTLPEVVRLAWLLGQLNLEAPVYAERVHADRLPHVARCALLPAALAAAAEVELVANPRDALPLALASWDCKTPPDVDAVELLTTWWETYREGRPGFAAALTALNRLFG